MRRFVEPDKTGRYRPYTPKERWVSGLNQQFTKLPIQKVREFESHSFRKCYPKGKHTGKRLVLSNSIPKVEQLVERLTLLPVWRNWHTHPS